jgi:FecR protein
MRRAPAIVCCLSLGALINCVDGVYAAQPDIGSAALAKNDVSRELSGANGPVDVGDPVFSDEIVRTGADSATKLVFRDSTNLALGPRSKVVLDRFVYDPSQPSEGLGVTLAKGVFRFTTGSLKKSAYTVTTPTAVIGVRGTVFDTDVTAHRTRVTLREGGALVCPRKKGISFEEQARRCEKGHSSHCDCADLTVVGQTAQASNGASNAVLVSTPVQFANFCSGALCSAENYASLSNPGLTNPSFPGSGTPSTPAGAPITPPIVPPVIVPVLGLVGILGASGALTQPSSVSP